MAQKTPIWQFKAFQNWVKTIMISELVETGDTVSEFCCGTGLDTGKWERSKIHKYIGFDASQEDLNEAESKWKQKSCPYEAEFIRMNIDCFDGMQYAFSDFERAKTFVKNVSSRLKFGGYFFGIIPDSSAIWYKSQKVTSGMPSVKSTLFNIEFDSDIFGFYGLEATNLSEFYEENKKNYESKLKQSGVTTGKNKIDTAQMELIKEIINGFKKLKIPSSEESTNQFMNHVDTNHDGSITFEEFDAYAKKNLLSLKKVFDELDINHNGTLDIKEIEDSIKKLGLPLYSDQELVRLFHRIDSNKDGKIDFDEWRELLILLPNSNISAIIAFWKDAQILDSGTDFGGFVPPPVILDALKSSKTLNYMFAGAVAGVISRTLTAPMERVKIVYQIHHGKHHSLVDTFKYVYRDGGFRGLWRGNLANILKVSPEAAVKFATYEKVKRLFAENDADLTSGQRFTSGAAAGVASHASLYPLEVIRTRLSASHTGTYKGIIDCIVQTAKSEKSIRPFYRGLSASIFSTIPHSGINMTVYETLKHTIIKNTKKDPTTGELLFCASASSGISTCISYPLHVIKARLATQGTPINPEIYKGTIDGLKQTIKKEGFTGLYRGIIPNFMKSIPSHVNPFSSPTQTCNEDWECGNVPYQFCKNRLNIFQGIKVDGENGKIYLIGKFNNSGTQYGKPNFVSIPIQGGKPKVEYIIESDIESGSNAKQTYRLLDYLTESETLYTGNYERYSPSFGNYDPDTKKYYPYWYARGYTYAVNFDEDNDKTYYCDVGVRRLNFIPRGNVSIQNPDLMYKDQRCNFLSRNNQDTNLYIAFIHYEFPNNTYTVFYRANTGCTNCESSQLVELFRHDGDISGFVVSPTHIYFSSKPGYYTNDSHITEVPINGDTTKLRALVSDPTTSIDYYNNFIYYTTVDNKVKKVSLAGNHPQTTVLYDAESSKGDCSCSDGFTGINCSICNGILRWNNGVPTCIGLNPDGTPSQCFNDWDCNMPYAYCNGICMCHLNFTGPYCTKCDGNVSWENGFPICTIL
eukprot:gene1443-1818_t